MLEAAVSVSESGDIVSADHRFADIVAEPPTELVNEALHSYVQRGDRERLTRFLFSAGVDSHLEVTLMRSDGKPAPVRLRLSERRGDRLIVTVIATPAP